ncbi:MAG: alpha/beta hydrolase family protein [Candidatus Pacebacteria bacterium]|nr:alpha/beta hydrolase family protein [Candidatus Paceibacterota bacterium]
MNEQVSNTNEKTLHSNRADGRFTTIEGSLHARLKNLAPELVFSPDMKGEALVEWRRRVRVRLRELLAFPVNDEPQPEPRMLWAEARDGYELQKWEAYPEPYSVVPFLMLVPDGITDRSPGAAVMCFPGSSATKERLAGEPEIVDWPVSAKHPERNKMARHYARAGLIAVAVDHPDRGERTTNMFEDSRYQIGVHALWLGRSFEGISVFEKWTIYNWLKKQNLVDASRIATSGHSLGAKPALHLGVLEPEIAAVVWNDFCSNWRTREVMVPAFRPHLGHYIPGMQKWFDYTDLMAALAPRPLLITEGGRTQDIETIRAAWQRCGAPQNFKVSYYPKYATPDQRPHDNDPLYEGMSMDDFFEYANVDVPQHCFKENIAVPWLKKMLGA